MRWHFIRVCPNTSELSHICFCNSRSRDSPAVERMRLGVGKAIFMAKSVKYLCSSRKLCLKMERKLYLSVGSHIQVWRKLYLCPSQWSTSPSSQAHPGVTRLKTWQHQFCQAPAHITSPFCLNIQEGHYRQTLYMFKSFSLTSRVLLSFLPWVSAAKI